MHMVNIFWIEASWIISADFYQCCVLKIGQVWLKFPSSFISIFPKTIDILIIYAKQLELIPSSVEWLLLLYFESDSLFTIIYHSCLLKS